MTASGTPVSSAESQEVARSVMESTGCGNSKSDRGLGIMNTVCLFCVAGSCSWVNCKNLLVIVGLRDEIVDTREADRLGDGGAIWVSSVRATTPIVIASQRGNIVFSVAPSKHLLLFIGRNLLTSAQAVVDMVENTLRIFTPCDIVVVSRAGWTLGTVGESTHMVWRSQHGV